METYEMWLVGAVFIFTWWIGSKETDRLMVIIRRLEDQTKDLSGEVSDLKREVERCKRDIDNLEYFRR